MGEPSLSGTTACGPGVGEWRGLRPCTARARSPPVLTRIIALGWGTRGGGPGFPLPRWLCGQEKAHLLAGSVPSSVKERLGGAGSPAGPPPTRSEHPGVWGALTFHGPQRLDFSRGGRTGGSPGLPGTQRRNSSVTPLCRVARREKGGARGVRTAPQNRVGGPVRPWHPRCVGSGRSCQGPSSRFPREAAWSSVSR